MTSVLRGPANLLRRALIRTSLDTTVGAMLSRGRGGAVAKALRPDSSLYPRPSLRRVKRDGICFDLDLSDYMQWTVYYGVERAQRGALYDLVGPGDIAIDVGTNIGEVLLNFARMVGPTGRAIGFEANPVTHALCCSNLGLNPFPWAEVHAVGLGHIEGELDFGRRCEANSGADSFTPAGAGTIKAAVTTLDRFVEQATLNRIDLIKIDTEGFDLNVLMGAEQSLQRFSPRLFVELCDENLRAHGGSAEELVRFLERIGYRVTNAETAEPVRSSNDFTGCFLDIIGRPE